MPKTRSEKETIVQNLKDKLARAKSVIFADYRGLTMKQLSQLRNELRNQNAEFTITKNTLLDLALPSSKFQVPSSHLEGPTATLFVYDDQISPLKILAKTLKDAALGKVKLGFMGEEPLDEDTILKLAALPSKDELTGQIVGVLAAPLQGMIGVLQRNLRNLMYALSELQKQKGGV